MVVSPLGLRKRRTRERDSGRGEAVKTSVSDLPWDTTAALPGWASRLRAVEVMRAEVGRVRLREAVRHGGEASRLADGVWGASSSSDDASWAFGVSCLVTSPWVWYGRAVAGGSAGLLGTASMEGPAMSFIPSSLSPSCSGSDCLVDGIVSSGTGV
ncbi:unnamed protein product [Phytomonas sp. EM1]|nr:unnamed protein product [Phytomonas sp. EM1]|eukprot:CCW64176.1 unnamed protein product [Phytomonas sp. isolate EM1]